MGEVYRARDAPLDREVAVKVLPSLFTSDPQRIERFAREARLLASLNHPNIATIHGIERTCGIHALVLELVEGETVYGHPAGPELLEAAAVGPEARIEAVDLRSGARRIVLRGGGRPRSASGPVTWCTGSGQSIMALPFDADRLEVLAMRCRSRKAGLRPLSSRAMAPLCMTAPTRTRIARWSGWIGKGARKISGRLLAITAIRVCRRTACASLWTWAVRIGTSGSLIST